MSAPGQVYPTREQAWTAAQALSERQARMVWIFVHGTRYLVTETMNPGRYWSFVDVATSRAYLERIRCRAEEGE